VQTVLKAMFSCQEASRLASRAMEVPLGPLERRVFALHLMMCTGCVNFSRQLELLRSASEKLPEKLEIEDTDAPAT